MLGQTKQGEHEAAHVAGQKHSQESVDHVLLRLLDRRRCHVCPLGTAQGWRQRLDQYIFVFFKSLVSDSAAFIFFELIINGHGSN